MSLVRCSSYSYVYRKSSCNEAQNRMIDRVQPVLNRYSIEDHSVCEERSYIPPCTTLSRKKRNPFTHVALADHINPNEVYVLVDDHLGTYPQAALKVANLLRKHGFLAEVANAQIGSKYYVKVHCSEIASNNRWYLREELKY